MPALAVAGSHQLLASFSTSQPAGAKISSVFEKLGGRDNVKLAVEKVGAHAHGAHGVHGGAAWAVPAPLPPTPTSLPPTPPPPSPPILPPQNQFYERIMADPLVSPFFKDIDMKKQKAKQMQFMTLVRLSHRWLHSLKVARSRCLAASSSNTHATHIIIIIIIITRVSISLHAVKACQPP